MLRKKNISRRQFLSGAVATAAAFTVVPRHVLGGSGYTPPSEKVNVACIGTGVQGIIVMKKFLRDSDVQVVAVCDVNKGSSDYRGGETAGREPAKELVENYYAEQKSAGTYRGCATYIDFRKMLRQHKDIDAVIVATPDHVHAVASMMAIRMGKHVYCEKPLTHTVYEARKLTEAARKYKVITQMGIQLHATESLKLLVEMIALGVIGPVREVHAWAVDAPYWPQGILRPVETPPVPDSLDWDLWLGPAPERPYHPAYRPRRWRGWYDFGGGALGDMACHIIDPAFWALKLGYPMGVEAHSSIYTDEMGVKVANNETYPRASIVRYEFPARGDMPPVKLTWYDGGLMPARPEELEEGRDLPGTGELLIGEKGTILAPHGGSPKLIPESRMKGFKPPEPFLPRGVDHYQEWIRACRGGPKPLANFDYASPLTEVVLRGCVAIRSRKRLIWDGPNMKVTNLPEANEYIHYQYRQGWTL